MTKQTTKTNTATTGDAAAQIGSKAKTKAATVSHAKPKAAPKAKPTKQEQAAAAVARMRQAALDLVQPSPVAEIVQIPVNFVSALAQVRTEFDDSTIAELAADIADRGIIQPILVRKGEHGYLIVAGERRFRAAKLAGLEMIPAIVTALDNDAAAAVQIAENIQREDLSLADTAKAVRKLYELNGNSVTATATKLHKSKSWVSKHLAASCEDLAWQARQLLEEGATEDLEIVLTIHKIADLSYWGAKEVADKVRKGEAGRQTVRNDYDRIKAEKEAENAERAKANAAFNSPEAQTEREKRHLKEWAAEQERNAAMHVDPLHLRWKDVKTLDDEQRAALTEHLAKLHYAGNDTSGYELRQFILKSHDYSELEILAFMTGHSLQQLDLDRLQEEIDHAEANAQDDA